MVFAQGIEGVTPARLDHGIEAEAFEEPGDPRHLRGQTGGWGSR